MPPVLLVYTSIRYRLPRFSPKTILYHAAVKIQLPPPDVMGAAEGGCCTPGALCHVARRNGCSRGRLLHSWGAFFGLVQRKRPRPRKENRLLPYPTTTQPHSRVPYPTGQNGHAFPRNPARQTLATWAYVAATMLCCSTFHARDVKDAAPYKAFARHSQVVLTTRQRYAKRFCICQRSSLLWQRGGAM